MTRYLITALISTFSLLAGGEELPRPVLQEYRLEIGGGTALSTYLSPLRYDGTVIGMSGRQLQGISAT